MNRIQSLVDQLIDDPGRVEAELEMDAIVADVYGIDPAALEQIALGPAE